MGWWKVRLVGTFVSVLWAASLSLCAWCMDVLYLSISTAAQTVTLLAIFILLFALDPWAAAEPMFCSGDALVRSAWDICRMRQTGGKSDGFCFRMWHGAYSRDILGQMHGERVARADRKSVV